MTTVLERGLVSEKVKWKDVVNSHQAYSQAHLTTPQFKGGPVLGYVTPVSHVWVWVGNPVLAQVVSPRGPLTGLVLLGCMLLYWVFV